MIFFLLQYKFIGVIMSDSVTIFFIIIQTFFSHFEKLQFFPIFYGPLYYAVVVNNVLCTRIGFEARVQFKMVPSARACYIFYICKYFFREINSTKIS